MSDLVEMLKSQVEAINRAYLQGLEQGRVQGRVEGLKEAQQLLQDKFPDLKIPVTP